MPYLVLASSQHHEAVRSWLAAWTPTPWPPGASGPLITSPPPTLDEALRAELARDLQRLVTMDAAAARALAVLMEGRG